MLVGDPSHFAIESHVELAYANRGQLALGYFLLHVDGETFGVRAHNASLLACSYDEVRSRIRRRGRHTVPFASYFSAEAISQAIVNGYLAGIAGELEDAIEHSFASAHVTWAPDGDEAFDDGSFVLQFDVADKVRLVAFKTVGYGAASVREAWVGAQIFYSLLTDWVAEFDREWELRPKL